MAGMDPDKDVEISVSDGILHIEAHREFEEKEEGKNYYRREMRYGSFRRDSPAGGLLGGRCRGRIQGRDPRGPDPGAQSR